LSAAVGYVMIEVSCGCFAGGGMGKQVIWDQGPALFSRRDLLKVGAIGLAGCLAPPVLGKATPADPSPRATARSVIVLWMAGGVTHIDSLDPKPDAPEEIRAACQRVSTLEKRRGYSLAGPQRDDLRWTRKGRPFASEASSGEVARTMALVRLAEWRAVAASAGEAPLFGVDDFDAGLSEASAEQFFEALPREAAVVLTTASAPARWARRAAAVIEVREGSASATQPLRAVRGGLGGP